YNIVLLSVAILTIYFFFFPSRRRHTRSKRDWSSDVCSSDLPTLPTATRSRPRPPTGRAGSGESSPRESCARLFPARPCAGSLRRSEERRVGKECRIV